MVRGDGSGDTCPSGKVCKDTKACAPDGKDPSNGADPSAKMMCGSGTCKDKATVSPSDKPKPSDDCTTTAINPVGTCGSNLQCAVESCTGDNIGNIRCKGKCKARAGNTEDCSYNPGQGKQGNCTAGYYCKADGTGCTSIFCRGKCAPNPTEKPSLPPPVSPPCAEYKNGKCAAVVTAFGNISTTPTAFVTRIYGIILAFSGGIAVLLLMRAGYRIMTSQGNPEALKDGREQATATVIGLLFLIFAFVLLQVIAYDLLRIPGVTP